MFRLLTLYPAALLAVLLLLADRQVIGADDESDTQQQTEAGGDLAIHRALKKPITLKAVEMPLSDVLEQLSRTAGIPNLRVDARALGDAEIPTDGPVTADFKGISLHSALILILRDLDLTYLVRNGALVITTPEEACRQLHTEVFDVLDLVTVDADDSDNPATHDYDTLIELITSTVAPVTWVDAGGAGDVEGYRGTLVVSQSTEVLRQLSALLETLRRANHLARQHWAKTPPATSRVVGRTQPSAIDRAFAKKIDYELKAVPLEQVAEHLERTHGIRVWLDRRSLRDVGLGVDTPLTLVASGLTLRQALDHLLGPARLAYARQDELLIITTLEEAECTAEVRIYPVSDLVLPPQHGWLWNDVTMETESLVDIITSVVAPTTWSDAGGSGTMETFDTTLLLVVSQTGPVHEEIDRLLTKLRQKISIRPHAAAQGEKDRTDAGAQLEDDRPGGLQLIIYSIRTKSVVEAESRLARGGAAEPASGRFGGHTPAPPGGGGVGGFPPGGSAVFEDAELLEIVQELVEPQSWRAEGVYARAGAGRLIIRQTPAVHRKVNQLLGRLGVVFFEMPYVSPGGFPMGGMGGMPGGGLF